MLTRILIVLLCLASPCCAQLPDAPRPKPIEHVIVTGVSLTFSMLDASTTREGVTEFPGRVHEIDPLHSPFVHSDSLYVVHSAEVSGAAYLGWKMHHSQVPIIRHLWFLPQAGLIAANAWGFENNRDLIHRLHERGK